jgi:hypothetical protein
MVKQESSSFLDFEWPLSTLFDASLLTLRAAFGRLFFFLPYKPQPTVQYCIRCPGVFGLMWLMRTMNPRAWKSLLACQFETGTTRLAGRVAFEKGEQDE